MVPKKFSAALIVLFIISFISSVYLVMQNRVAGSGRQIKLKSILATVVTKKSNIAIIEINGIIRASMRQHMLVRDFSIVDQLKEVGRMDNIKAVLLRINSPGGSVASVQEIYSEIEKLRAGGKKVVASFADVSASGGYYVAAACDKIVANPGTITGSIGVIMEIGNVEELLKKIGVKLITIKSGKYKDIGSPTRELTEDEREIFQSLINDAYDQFIEAVTKGRGIDRDTVLALADGRVFTGRQAFKVGLVDSLGGKEDAILVAAEIAGIKKEDIRTSSQKDSLKYFIRMLETKILNFQPFMGINIGKRPGFRLEYIME